jgi:fermentation-respiration switch protein FrsA (DUF1100 family)
MSAAREKARFASEGTECAAWHYPGTNGACVVMAGGGAVTKEPGTDPFAKRFHEAGFSVLAFDYRRLGESGGLTGEPGTVAFLSTPDGLDGDRALNPGNRYPEWQQEIAARSIPPIAAYRPGRHASRIRCPLLVLAADQDQTALAAPAVAAASRAPHAELVRMPGGHYEPFLDGHERAVEAELDFLRRHLLDPAQRTAAGPRAVRE